MGNSSDASGNSSRYEDVADHSSLSMEGITFEPNGPFTECVNITIERDLIVENVETFRFFVDPNQEDEAVMVGSPDSAIVTIVDEEEGSSSLGSTITLLYATVLLQWL